MRGAAALEQQDRLVGLRQALGDDDASRAAAYDNVIVGGVGGYGPKGEEAGRCNGPHGVGIGLLEED